MHFRGIEADQRENTHERGADRDSAGWPRGLRLRPRAPARRAAPAPALPPAPGSRKPRRVAVSAQITWPGLLLDVVSQAVGGKFTRGLVLFRNLVD